MSALVHVASPQTKKAPVAVPPGTYPLSLPDGAKFSIVVSHERLSAQAGSNAANAANAADAEQAQRVRHSIKLSSHKSHDWIDTASTLAVKAPWPPYPNPASEPDTNSLAFRTQRFGECELQASDAEQILWNRSLKPVMVFGMVNTSCSTSPSELIIKQSCLSLATSIPTDIIVKTSRGIFVMLYPQGALLS